MYFNKCKLIASLAICLSAYSLCLAQQPTHTKEEMKRFRQFRSGYPFETIEQYWEGILGLEQLLADYPNTFLKGDISITLLGYYQHITDDPHLLIELSDKMLALQMYSNGAYQTAARTLVDKKVRSDKTLLYAQNALKEALQKQEKWENYGKRELICRDMVASFRYQSAPLLTFALGDLEMRKAFGSAEIPYTCIIDQNGQIRYERKGLGADFSVAMAHQLQWVGSSE